MDNNPPSRVELLQGTLDLLILRTLMAGPSHGHAIAKHIQRTSEDLLQVETGSLYPALHRLEAKGWIGASWDLSDKGKRARYYRLTTLGRKQLASRTIQMAGVLPRHGIDLEPGGSGGAMTSFFRKLRLAAAASGQGSRASGGTPVPPGRGSRRAPGARAGRRRSAARGPPGIGKRRTRTGGHARRVDLDSGRTTGAGHPLRPAHDSRQQDVQRDGDPVARPGNRRQHSDLQLHGFDPAALAAGARSAVPGDAELAYPAPRHARLEPA